MRIDADRSASSVTPPGGSILMPTPVTANAPLGSALKSVVETLGRRAALHPDRVALIAGPQQVSYRELWERTLAAAQEFSRCGVSRGDRVLLSAPSVPAFSYGYFATHLLGAIAVVLDPNAPPTRRDELYSRTTPKLVIGDNPETHSGQCPFRSIADIDTLQRTGTVPALPKLDETADLMFTTGTTGRPKGVRLTHGNLAAAAFHINAVIENGDQDVEVLPLPLNHSFGLGRLRCNLVAGGTVVLVDGFRLPGEIFSAIEKHRATGLVGVPAGFAVLLRFGARGLGPFAHQLQYVEIGSAPMPAEQKLALMELLPTTRLWMHYGLTEASRSLFIEFHRHREQLDSVGVAAPGVHLSVRRDDGSACNTGESGLLWIGGPHVAKGYWDDPDYDSRAFSGGYVCSGDIAHIGVNGYVYLHGRKDDMINVGGFNVSPDEIEQVLALHPGVREAACVGMPDPKNISGHVLHAYLVRDSGHRQPADVELSDWIRIRLEAYKIPIQYRWIESLPRTTSGKLMRATLRSRAST